MSDIRSIGALVRFELSRTGCSLAHQTLLIGGVLKFVQDNFANELHNVTKLEILNLRAQIRVRLDVSLNFITTEADIENWFDGILERYLSMSYPPGCCPVRTDFTWKWDKVYRLQDVGDENLSALFDAANPSETWKRGRVECEYCKSYNDIAVPQEVRGSECVCRACGRSFFFQASSILQGRVNSNAERK